MWFIYNKAFWIPPLEPFWIYADMICLLWKKEYLKILDHFWKIGPKCLLPPCTFGSTQYNKLRHSATQEYRSRATVCRAATSSGRLIQKRMVFDKQLEKMSDSWKPTQNQSSGVQFFKGSFSFLQNKFWAPRLVNNNNLDFIMPLTPEDLIY